MLNSAFYNLMCGFCNRIWFWSIAVVTLLLIAIYCLAILDEVSQKVELTCNASLYPDCFQIKKYTYFGIIGVLGLMGLISLFKMLRCRSVLLNFACMPIMGKPARRCMTWCFPLAYSLYQIAIFAFCWAYFVVAMTNGLNEDVATEADFPNTFVRRQIVPWYKFYGAIFVLYVGLSLCGFLLAYQKSLLATIAAQWYFSRTKDWLRETIQIGKTGLVKHYGSFFFHAFTIWFFAPLRVVFSSCKYFINQQKYPNKCLLCLIKTVKPYVFCYDFVLKFKFGDT